MTTEYFKDKQKLVGIRYMLFIIAAINAIVSIGLYAFSSFFAKSIPFYFQAFLISVLAYVIPIFVYAKSNKITAEIAADKFYLKNNDARNIILALFMGAGFQFLMIVVNLPINLIFNEAGDTYVIGSLWELFAAGVVVAIIPAVFEEFLFRGIVLGSMAEFNTKAAVVFSAIMFALLHSDIYGFLGYLLMGVILAYITLRCKSIYPAVMFHFSNNLIAVLLAYFNDDLGYEPGFTIFLFIVGILVFAITFIIFLKKSKNQKSVALMKFKVLLGQSFINVPIILCVLSIMLTAFVIRFIG